MLRLKSLEENCLPRSGWSRDSLTPQTIADDDLSTRIHAPWPSETATLLAELTPA